MHFWIIFHVFSDLLWKSYMDSLIFAVIWQFLADPFTLMFCEFMYFWMPYSEFPRFRDDRRLKPCCIMKWKKNCNNFFISTFLNSQHIVVDPHHHFSSVTSFYSKPICSLHLCAALWSLKRFNHVLSHFVRSRIYLLDRKAYYVFFQKIFIICYNADFF